MTDQIVRLREADLDACLERLLLQNGPAAARFVATALPEELHAPVHRVDRQTSHVGAPGSIDLDVILANGVRLLCENKIGAGWSITARGLPQPERYARTVSALRDRGVPALAVLVAPRAYLEASRQRALFEAWITYETLAEGMSGRDGDLLRAAIRQAETPYEPVPDAACGAFHADYASFAAAAFPDLVVKRNPNGAGVRPAGSRTIYFDATRMLRLHPGLPLPRISVQSRDSGAGRPSAKLMLGGCGHLAGAMAPPASLSDIGAYLRPAGRSLGIVIDTPALDVLATFEPQIGAARAGLEAIDRLRRWWNAEGMCMSARLDMV